MLSQIIILGISFFHSVVIYASFVEPCDDEITRLMIRGFRFEASPFWTAKVQSLTACAQACIIRKVCQSFNFNEETKVCELNEEFGIPSVTEKYGIYADVTDIPSQVDPDCFSRPCGHDELCIPMSAATGVSCAHSCFKLARSCPLPHGGSTTQPRTVGSVFTCGPGSINSNDSAVCLPDGTWSQPLNCEQTTKSTSGYNESCVSDADCWIPNTSCLDSRCQCSNGYRHTPANDTCTKYCTTYGSTFALIEGNQFSMEPPVGEKDNVTLEDCKTFCAGFDNCTGFNYCETCGNLCRCKVGSFLELPWLISMNPNVDYYNRNCA